MLFSMFPEFSKKRSFPRPSKILIGLDVYGGNNLGKGTIDLRKRSLGVRALIVQLELM
jgi:hypothetical protein